MKSIKMNNKSPEQKVYKADHLRSILESYYLRKEELKGNDVENNKPIVLVHNDAVAELLDQGFRSTVYKVPVDFTYRFANKSKERQLCICIKEYGEGKIIDSSTFEYDKTLHQREVRSLEVLTKYTSFLPDLIGYEDGGLKIYMQYLGPDVLGKIFGELHSDDLEVLTEIANKITVKQSELVVKHKNRYDLIKELIKMKLIISSPSGQTRILGLAPKFDKRFKIENGKLVEKEEYKKDRVEKLNGGLETIFELQKVAKEHKDELFTEETMLPYEISIKRLDKIVRKFRQILRYDMEEEKKESGLKYFLSKESEIKRDYTQDINGPITLEVSKQKDIVGGDSHALNMMIKNNKVYLTDLFHMAVDHWTVDFVDYITYLNLFCSLDLNEVDSFYHNVYARRRLVNEKEDFKNYQDIRRRVDLDRAIVAAGSLSGILLNFKDKFNGYEQRQMEKRRKAYLEHIRNLLPVKSELNGKPLFIKSRPMIENCLFS